MVNSMLLKSCKVIVLSIMAVLTYGCGSTIEGKSGYNPDVNFAQYDSFAWISPNPLISAPSDVNPINVQRIQSEIVSVLTAKDYRQVQDPTVADFTISFTIGRREQIDIRRSQKLEGGIFDFGNSIKGEYGSYLNYDTYTEQYTEGILTIDIFDVETNSPAWHGWAGKRITAFVEINAAPVITEAVNEILENFPPLAISNAGDS